jgi:pentatricopeptide repeat protein
MFYVVCYSIIINSHCKQRSALESYCIFLYKIFVLTCLRMANYRTQLVAHM